MAQVNLSRRSECSCKRPVSSSTTCWSGKKPSCRPSTMLSAGERIESSTVVARVLSEIQELLGY